MAKDICIALGKRIRQLRLERGWRQIDLAEEAGLHENFISELEQGSKEACLRTLQKIARALDLKSDELLRNID
jgi:XRE family transcriptional regulator, regulator of sulfur utilization